MKPLFFRNILIGLLAFLSIGAIFGGVTLILSPSGELLHMPLAMIKDSPFPDYLIPGIFLFLVLGVVPGLLTVALVKKPESKTAQRFNLFKDSHWAWSFSIYVGLILILWLQLEMAFIHAVHWFHTFYMLLAVIILIVALLPQVRGIYKI